MVSSLRNALDAIRRFFASWPIRSLAAFLLIVIIVAAVSALGKSKLSSPEPTLLLLDRNQQFLAEIGKKDGTGYGYWPVNGLPERVVAATLALEDHRFWTHPGVDPFALMRAAWQNISNRRRVSGASTIAMQVARLQNPGPRTYSRKAIESLTAIFMTLRYGREAILRHYLRLVPYANDSHGIVYAARRYLDKPVEDLSWAEIAFLSAIPQAPGKMNPFTLKGRRRAVNRGKHVLKALHNKRVLSEEEYKLAGKQIEMLHIPKNTPRPSSSIHAILKLEEIFKGEQDWKKSHKRPLIRTTLDLDLQSTVEKMAASFLEKWKSKGAENVALVIADRANMDILAWLGSAGYFDSKAGAIDYVQVPRSPGSALKPFIYALALERGDITPATVLQDLPAFSGGISNADMRYMGPILPRYALANSRNVPAIRLLKDVGLNEVYLFFQNLGLHDSQWPAEYYGLGMAVGGLPVKLEKLLRAYSVLANDGLLSDLTWYKDQPKKKPLRVLSAATARQITLFLSDPLARLPSFPRMGTTEYPFPVAVKTGTSQGYRDAWAVAYSRNYIICIWTGRPDARPMNHLGGAGSSAHLAQKILLDLHKEQASGMTDFAFSPPENYQRAEICTYTGEVTTGKCEPTFEEWFPPGQIPEEDRHYQTFTIDGRNGLLATPWTPKDEVERRIFLTLPAIFADWGARKGLPSSPKRFSPLDIPESENSKKTRFSHKKYGISRSDKKVSISLTSPDNGLRIIINPEAPHTTNSLALRAAIEPAVEQAIWYVDGEPFKLVPSPYTLRWPLLKGDHTFQVRLPYRNEISKIVKVSVE
ncbi:MAG: penicillin-binding protein 1C [Proteobacteria bacterium]|nr:penicillin-binding protein 1C [Pseudomonadota bacterium]